MNFRIWLRGLVFGPKAFFGWFLIFAPLILQIIGLAGDMEFISFHLGEVGRFLETGWGMAAVMILGALLIAYSGHVALESKKKAVRVRIPYCHRNWAAST